MVSAMYSFHTVRKLCRTTFNRRLKLAQPERKIEQDCETLSHYFPYLRQFYAGTPIE
jgi:hypothetical protein